MSTMQSALGTFVSTELDSMLRPQWFLYSKTLLFCYEMSKSYMKCRKLILGKALHVEMLPGEGHVS